MLQNGGGKEHSTTSPPYNLTTPKSQSVFIIALHMSHLCHICNGV